MIDPTLANPLNWDIDPKPDNKQLKQFRREQKELDYMFYRCFSTAYGKRVLQHLIENTIHSGTWLASLPYEKAIAHGFAREGQNALVKTIKDRTERGKTVNLENDDD